ncbi:MAG: PQQ-binding-like beta-propeller repeat protein [Candidatus Promineifilaceae bacterium]
MYEKKRPITWPVILIFSLAALVISACGSRIANNSWPGLAANGDVVYVAYGAGVIAVDVVEEKQVWSYPEESSPTLQFYAEPSVGDGRIVLGDYGASGGMFSPGVKVGIYALDESDGNLSTEWVQDAVAKDRIVAAPVQAEGLVFVGTADNFVIAFKADSGEVAWEFEAQHSIWSTPTYQDGVLYVGSLDKHIYALEAKTGNLMWEQSVAGSVSGQVVVGSDLIYVGSFDKQLHALDKATGEIRWEAPEGGTEDWVWAAPVLADDVVYFTDKKGHVFAVEAETGRPIWDVQLSGQVVASPVYANGTLFIASAGESNNNTADEIRRGALIALDAETGDELWREETSAAVYSTPVIVGDTVVIALPPGGESLLVVYNQADGNEIWQYSPPTEEK